MNKNGEERKNTMNSRLRALTLDPFIRDSGEKLTGRRLKRSMEEVDVATLLGRKRVSSPTMMVAAAWSRFACGGAVTSEKTKEEDEVEGLRAGQRRSIYGCRGVTVADLLRARSPWQFPRRRRNRTPRSRARLLFPSVATEDPVASLIVLSGSRDAFEQFRRQRS